MTITLQRRGPIDAEFAGPGPAAITSTMSFGSGFMSATMMMMMSVVIMVMTVEVMTMRRRCKDDNVGCRPQSARVDKDQGAMLLLWGKDQGFEFHSFPGTELLQYIRADLKGGPRSVKG